MCLEAAATVNSICGAGKHFQLSPFGGAAPACMAAAAACYVNDSLSLRYCLAALSLETVMFARERSLVCCLLLAA